MMNPLTNEKVYITRSLPSNDVQTSRYAGTGLKLDNINSPLTQVYKEPGTYNAMLILTTTNGQTNSCIKKIKVWQQWCTNPKADNFNHMADIDDNSCIITPGRGHVKIVTKKPYTQSNNTLHGHIQYNGNEKLIKMEIQLAQQGRVKYDFTTKINRKLIILYFHSIPLQRITDNHVVPMNIYSNISCLTL